MGSTRPSLILQKTTVLAQVLHVSAIYMNVSEAVQAPVPAAQPGLLQVSRQIWNIFA